MRGNDREVERALADLQRARARQAPGFDRLIETRSTDARPAGSAGRARHWAAVAAAVLLGMLLLSPGGGDRPRPDPLSEIGGIARWSAATDVFLPGSHPRWSSGLPPLGDLDLTVYTGARDVAPAARM